MSSQLPASSSILPEAGKDDTQIAILATLMVILVIVAVGAVVYFTIRWRAYQLENDPEGRPRAVDRTHVAGRITPYGSQSNLTPHFNHKPGIDMRIATRRPDGAWEFSHPGTAFNPTGVTEIEPVSSKSISVPPTPSSLEPPKSPVEIMKERESQAARLIREGYDAREFNEASPPPPAYGHESSCSDRMRQHRTYRT